MGYIYLVENLINNKKYIGQTIQNDINKRWNKHKQVNKSFIGTCLFNAYKNSLEGRPGPVWLSVPIDIQGSFMEQIDVNVLQKNIINEMPSVKNLECINELLQKSERPVIIAGNGTKLGNCREKIKQFLGKGVVEERQKIIDALKSFGFNGDDDLWDLYTLEELKIEFKRIKK